MTLRRHAALALAAALIVSACTAAPAATPTPTMAPTGQPTATAEPTGGLDAVGMTTFATCGEIWNWWAQEKGIYEAHGLQMEQVRAGGGAAAIAAVVSDSADFGYSNGFSVINAYVQGFQVKFASGAVVTALPPLPTAQGLWIKSDSDIQTPQDLVGKKVAVNELAGLNQIVVSAWLEQEGVDPTDVRFVALPFGAMAAAVTEGTVDGASSSAPTFAGVADQVRSVGDPFAELGEPVIIAGYVMRADMDEDVASRFHDAIKQAMAEVQDPANRDEAFQVMATACNGDAEALKARPDNAFEPNIDPAVVNRMAAFMVEQGLLGAEPDLSGVTPEFATR